MARVLASRAHGDEARQERLERAAARFSSIHDRWSSITDAKALASPASGSGSTDGAVTESGERRDLTLPGSESGVCVTPILGIATSEEDEPRPRFKTLMGVPRNDPDVDDQAGLGAPTSLSQREHTSGDGETAELKRPTPPPLPERFLALPEAAPLPSMVASAASEGTRQSRETLPPQTSRAASQQASTLAPSLPDTARELVALRRSQRRRSWLVGVGSFAATLAVFVLAAPRERALAFRWLRDEYQSRVQPSLHTVADTARALKPSVVEPPVAGLAERGMMASEATEVGRVEEPPPRPGADSQAAPVIGNSAATAAPATEVASEPRSARPAEPSRLSPRGLPVAAARTDDNADLSASRPARAVPSKSGGIQPKSQVAAPRKRGTRAVAKATTEDVKPRAPRPTKERATRQNSPRRGNSGGIIRETPF